MAALLALHMPRNIRARDRAGHDAPHVLRIPTLRLAHKPALQIVKVRRLHALPEPIKRSDDERGSVDRQVPRQRRLGNRRVARRGRRGGHGRSRTIPRLIISEKRTPRLNRAHRSRCGATGCTRNQLSGVAISLTSRQAAAGQIPV